jgi:zinc transporter ZupT
LSSPVSAAILVFLIAVGGAAIGVQLVTIPALARRLVPFGGGVLLGIATFWIMPELAGFFGWTAALFWVATGFIALWIVDNYVYAVCPSCSHVHDHHQCGVPLHGFAGPLLIVASLHAFLDGWFLPAAAQTSFGNAFAAGIALHKLPEGLALGLMVRAALKSRSKALLGCTAAEFATIAGAVLEIRFSSEFGSGWTHGLLAFAAGSFLYLGYHAIHGEYKRWGIATAIVPALTGIAGSSMLRLMQFR